MTQTGSVGVSSSVCSPQMAAEQTNQFGRSITRAVVGIDGWMRSCRDQLLTLF